MVRYQAIPFGHGDKWRGIPRKIDDETKYILDFSLRYFASSDGYVFNNYGRRLHGFRKSDGLVRWGPVMVFLSESSGAVWMDLARIIYWTFNRDVEMLPFWDLGFRDGNVENCSMANLCLTVGGITT